MTRTFTALTFSLAALLCAPVAQAQPDNNQARPERPAPPTPEQRANKQAARIAKQLAFDDATTEKFTSTYTAYQTELQALRSGCCSAKQKADSVRTDKEAEECIKAGFEREQKELDLRKDYYEKFRKFLTAKQIERVYAIEASDHMRRQQPMMKRDQKLQPVRQGKKNKEQDKD